MKISKVIVRRYATGMRSSGNWGGRVGTYALCGEMTCFFVFFLFVFLFLPSIGFAKGLAVTSF